MPRRKQSEIDAELQEQEAVAHKSETFATRWFRDNCVNNYEDMMIICDAVAKSAEEQFSLYLKSGHNETFGIIFYGTFVSILQFLREKEKHYKEFTVEIGSSLNVGFSNNDDDENEKTGNFMPILEATGASNRSVVETSYSELVESTTAENYIRWKELNVKKNAEMMKEIQERTYQYLKREFKVSLRTSEAVISLFCIYIDILMSYMKHKYNELVDTNISEVSMNVLGLFDIFYSYNQDTAEDIIEFQPTVFTKLQLKSDERAELRV